MSETVETKRAYTSRWRTPEGARLVIRPRDIALFKLLLRYKYLPTKHIIALLPAGFTAWQTRLRQLRRAGYLYIEGAQRDHYKANYRDLVYSLAKKGLNELINRGIEAELPIADNGYPHQLLIDEVMASFELGAQSPISFETLDALDEGIPVTAKINGRDIPTHIQPDGKPFRIIRINQEQQRKLTFFCPGIEADIGTEPVETKDFERSSIKKKIALYLDVMEQGLAEQYFGRKSMYVPFITGTRARMMSMKESVGRMAGEYARFFLFKVHPNFHSQENQRPPSGHMVTEDWERAGFPNFNFLTS